MKRVDNDNNDGNDIGNVSHYYRNSVSSLHEKNESKKPTQTKLIKLNLKKFSRLTQNYIVKYRIELRNWTDTHKETKREDCYSKCECVVIIFTIISIVITPIIIVFKFHRK